MNKLQKIVIGVGAGLSVSTLALGIGMSLPGMGLQSQSFINSVEKVIDKKMPKGKLIIDTRGMMNEIAKNSLRFAVEQDLLSTLTITKEDYANNTDYWNAKWTEYKTYADNWFTENIESKYFGENKDERPYLDLNDYSHTIVDFDESAAKTFNNYGYTHAGISWIGQSGVVGNLLSSNYKSSDWYKDAQNQETVIDDALYLSEEGSSGGGLSAGDFGDTPADYVNNSQTPGTHIANNKAWFLNQQLTNITGLGKMGLTAESQAWLKENPLTADVKASDYSNPNFTKGIELTRAGVVFLVIIFPIVAVASLGAIGYVSVKKK